MITNYSGLTLGQGGTVVNNGRASSVHGFILIIL